MLVLVGIPVALALWYVFCPWNIPQLCMGVLVAWIRGRLR